MAITYGMSVKEFWEDDPDLFWAYRFSYYEKVRAEQEMFNYKAWLQGAYFYESISVALNNAFSKKQIQYSKIPYGFENNIEKNEKQRQKEIQMQVIDMKARIAQVNKIKSVALTNRET